MGYSTIKNQSAKRTYTGLEPELFDAIIYSYPDALTTRMVYEYNRAPGEVLLAGIVDCVYSDPTKTVIVSKTRIS